MTHGYHSALAAIIAQKKTLDGIISARDEAARASAQRAAAELLRQRNLWRTQLLPRLQHALHDINEALEEAQIQLREIPQRGPEPFVGSVIFVLFIDGQPVPQKLRIGCDRAGMLSVQRLEATETQVESLTATALDTEAAGRLLTEFISFICDRRFSQLQACA
ncbi:hypothetical protein [Elstera cyanobacteriorum]|uniref:hypothetical protein n=1 Tax=Elstera cyanobacteriorum TaxID=2022747 RepID=UPI002352EF41|nr:hypothetical protein [Elstera cyanobacteriorum]MCK6441781.1 hypothetical protein [Elstera cyanobacteriorum]